MADFLHHISIYFRVAHNCPPPLPPQSLEHLRVVKRIFETDIEICVGLKREVTR